MNDLISRQALMKEFANFVRDSNNSDFAQTPTWNDAVSLVESMPTAQPERKKGKWIKRSVSLYRCSECGRFHPAQENFCPSCGVEMEKNDEV